MHRVAISEHQRRGNPHVGWAATIHNGVDLAAHPCREDKEDYLVFLGRAADWKGPEQAVEVARKSGRHLKMLVKCEEPGDPALGTPCGPGADGRDEEILLSPPHATKVEVLGRAAGLLFPIQWEEPFGLVMAEALACGTPVIGLARGSVPEVVADGTTGFVVPTEDRMAEAVHRLAEISPAACRRRAERMFSAEVMADRYEALFRSLTDRPAART